MKILVKTIGGNNKMIFENVINYYINKNNIIVIEYIENNIKKECYLFEKLSKIIEL